LSINYENLEQFGVVVAHGYEMTGCGLGDWGSIPGQGKSLTQGFVLKIIIQHDGFLS